MIVSQIIANALIIGSVYALVAIGFSLIYSTNTFMHFAHGAVVAAAGYFFFAAITKLGLPFPLAVLCSLILTTLLGWATYRLLYAPLQKRKSSNVILLIASLGLLILIENLLLIMFGPDVKTIPGIPTQKGLSILGAIITPLQLWIIGISFALLFGMYVLMYRTKLGRNMRAVADNKELTSIIGINSRFIADMSFIVGSLLAGIAGILVSLEMNLTPSIGTGLMIKGFTGAVIGSISSVPGAILGSFILGFAENIGVWFLPSEYKDAIAFMLLFVFLLWKPQGLFGINKGVRK